MTKEKTQNWILEKLRANSLSQTKLSSYTEIHENTISRYCKGECLPGCFSALGRRASGSTPPSTTVWWPATVHRRDGTHTLTDEDTGEAAVLPVYVLRYDTDGDVGWDEQEECWSCFVG